MKAILVIDVPDGIDLSLVKGSLTVVSKDVRKLFMAETYQDLEVRPLPSYKEMFVGDRDRREVMLGKAYYKGWNACLDAITGGTE